MKHPRTISKTLNILYINMSSFIFTPFHPQNQNWIYRNTYWTRTLISSNYLFLWLYFSNNRNLFPQTKDWIPTHSYHWSGRILRPNVPHFGYIPKFHLWHLHLELKYFNSMYRHQRATTKSIKRLRIQAQKLLEEADLLQEQKSNLRQEIIRHLSNINKPELRWWLYNPTKVYPQPLFPCVREIISGSSCPQPHTVHFANPNHSFQPCILRCFQCDSPHHL